VEEETNNVINNVELTGNKIITIAGNTGSPAEIGWSDCLIGGNGITINSNSIISVNPDYTMQACLEYTVDKHFSERSYGFKQSLKDMFKTKTQDERLYCLGNMFTQQSLEFFKNMEDNELLNLLRISF
jgi:hypothetical protein